jgi:hypothetical protein
MDLLGTLFGGSPAKGAVGTVNHGDDFFLSALWKDAMGETGGANGGRKFCEFKHYRTKSVQIHAPYTQLA